jgi:hypothetical protein
MDISGIIDHHCFLSYVLKNRNVGFIYKVGNAVTAKKNLVSAIYRIIQFQNGGLNRDFI